MLLPMAPTTNNTGLNQVMSQMERYYIKNEDLAQLQYEILHKTDSHNTSKTRCAALEQQINLLLGIGSLKVFKINQVPKYPNVLCGRFLVTIKQPVTPAEL